MGDINKSKIYCSNAQIHFKVMVCCQVVVNHWVETYHVPFGTRASSMSGVGSFGA